MLERGFTVRGEGVTAPGTISMDYPIPVHGMWLDGGLLTDWRTAIGIVFGFICSKFKFATRVGVDEPLIAAGIFRKKPGVSLCRLSDTSGARRQDCSCGISPEGEFLREPQFEYNTIDCFWVIWQRALKAG